MPTNDPTQRVAILTGASEGIGRALALSLGRLGWGVSLVGRRPDPLHAVAAQLPAGSALVLPADVADTAQAPSIIGRTLERFGRIDALVNNAGLAFTRDIEHSTGPTLEQVFAVNALGPGALIAAVWPVFKRQRGGVIVNVSSMATQDPFPGLFAYAGAKAAVEVFARSIANEGAAHNIRGFAIAPGAVETAMLRGIVGKDDLPESATLDPQDIADIIVECLTGARDECNGQTILVPSPAPAG